MTQTVQICTIHFDIFMTRAINLLSVIPMRKEPAHRSEMVSQLLFGEYVQLTGQSGDFVEVVCLYDGYSGWVQENQLTITEAELPVTGYSKSWSLEVMVNGRSIYIPFASPVYSAAGQPVVIGPKEIRYTHSSSLVRPSEMELTETMLIDVCRNFLDSPYLWGGKSVFGIDCSGFVQQVFKLFGIALLRDASLQAAQGQVVQKLDEWQLADLAFFQNENGRVIHVGIILENDQIIHASGKVRIDRLDSEGILNVENDKRTHRLHSVRRLL